MTELPVGCGVVVEWFELFGGYTDPAIIPEMERDRLEYSERPGFIRKLLVVGQGADGGDLAGGIYFMRDPESAAAFLQWASHEHRDPDGNTFDEREYVGASEGYVGELIGHLGSDYSKELTGAVRIQRFAGGGLGRADLERKWAEAKTAFLSSGLLGASLVLVEDQDVVFVISVSAIRSEADALDRAALEELAGADLAGTLGLSDALADMSLWVHTIWEGYAKGSTAPNARWPNSPPLPSASY